MTSTSGVRVIGTFCPTCHKKKLKKHLFATFAGRLYCRVCNDYYTEEQSVGRTKKGKLLNKENTQ